MSSLRIKETNGGNINIQHKKILPKSASFQRYFMDFLKTGLNEK